MTTPSPVSVLDLELQPGRPAVLRAEPGADPPGWAAAHREAVRGVVLERGAVLVRGLGIDDPSGAAAVFRALADGLHGEHEAFAPRRALDGGVLSATPWPANQAMCMHQELSYALDVPGLLMFACLEAPVAGGATGVADAAAVLDALPADLVARFEQHGWQLVRSYTGEIGASVAEAFGTDDPAAVEEYCRTHAIETEWQPGGGLRTCQRRSAVVRHPVTGRRCWFNQIAFLNEWTLDPEVREYLVDVYGDDGLPFTTRYGDGAPVGEDVVARINSVYEAHTVREPWQAGDLLVVDNIRCAHDRQPFEGSREVLVGLAEPVRLADGLAGSAGGTP